MKRKEIIAVLGITVALTLTIASVKGYNANKKNETQSAAVNVEDNISSTTEESVTDISSVAEKDVAVEEQDNSKSEIAVSQTEVITESDMGNGGSIDHSVDEMTEEEVVNEIAESEEAVVEDVEPETPALDYEIEPMDDTVMYAQQNCNVRSGPSTDYDKVGSLSLNQEVTVNGKVKAANGKMWYVIKTSDGSTQMVAASLLGPNKVQQQQKPSGSGNSSEPSSGNNGNGSSTQPAQPSDCQPSDCDYGDCEGFCNISPGFSET